MSAGLYGDFRVEMAVVVGRFEVDSYCEDAPCGVFSSCGDGPVYQSFDDPSKFAGDLSIRLLTDVFDLKKMKLWSCVSLFFGMICPHSLIVSWVNNVHWGQDDPWNSFYFVQWDG